MEFKIARAINYLGYCDIMALAVVFGKGYEELWREVAYERWWGKQFWDKAGRRDPNTSHPYRVWRLEVLRNLRFEREIYPMIWEELDYYNFWEMRDCLK